MNRRNLILRALGAAVGTWLVRLGTIKTVAEVSALEALRESMPDISDYDQMKVWIGKVSREVDCCLVGLFKDRPPNCPFEPCIDCLLEDWLFLHGTNRTRRAIRESCVQAGAIAAWESDWESGGVSNEELTILGLPVRMVDGERVEGDVMILGSPTTYLRGE